MGRADHHRQHRARRLFRSVPGVPGRESVPRAQQRLGDAGVPGVRRLREHAAACGADVAPAVERLRAASVRRLARRRELPRQPLEPSLESDRAQSGGVRPWRDDRKRQPAARADSAERHPGSVLRDHRSARRHRTGQLRRHVALAPAPAQEQPERPLQLHAVEVHERSRDDGAHGSDDCEPGEPGSGLLLLLVGPPARPERVAGRANARFREQDGPGDLQRLADLADRPLAVGQPFQHHHRRGQCVDRSRRPASGSGARRSVRQPALRPPT